MSDNIIKFNTGLTTPSHLKKHTTVGFDVRNLFMTSSSLRAACDDLPDLARIVKKLLAGNVFITYASSGWHRNTTVMDDDINVVMIRDGGFNTLPNGFTLAKDLDVAYAIASNIIDSDKKRYTASPHIFIENADRLSDEILNHVEELLMVEFATSEPPMWTAMPYPASPRYDALLSQLYPDVWYINNGHLTETWGARVSKLIHLYDVTASSSLSLRQSC